MKNGKNGSNGKDHKIAYIDGVAHQIKSSHTSVLKFLGKIFKYVLNGQWNSSTKST